jgi:hypothetical protein
MYAKKPSNLFYLVINLTKTLFASIEYFIGIAGQANGRS